MQAFQIEQSKNHSKEKESLESKITEIVSSNLKHKEQNLLNVNENEINAEEMFELRNVNTKQKILFEEMIREKEESDLIYTDLGQRNELLTEQNELLLKEKELFDKKYAELNESFRFLQEQNALLFNEKESFELKQSELNKLIELMTNKNLTLSDEKAKLDSTYSEMEQNRLLSEKETSDKKLTELIQAQVVQHTNETQTEDDKDFEQIENVRNELTIKVDTLLKQNKSMTLELTIKSESIHKLEDNLESLKNTTSINYQTLFDEKNKIKNNLNDLSLSTLQKIGFLSDENLTLKSIIDLNRNTIKVSCEQSTSTEIIAYIDQFIQTDIYDDTKDIEILSLATKLEKSNQEIVAIQSMLNEKENLLKTYESDLAELKLIAEDATKMKLQITEINQLFADKLVDYDTLYNSLQSVQESNKVLQSSVSENANLISKYTELIKSIELDLKIETEKQTNFESNISNLQQNINERDNQITSLEKNEVSIMKRLESLDELNNTYSIILHERDQLLNEKSNFRVYNDKQLHRIEEFKSQITLYESSLDELRSNLNEKNSSAIESQELITILQTDIQRLNLSVTKMSIVIKTVAGLNDDIERKLFDKIESETLSNERNIAYESEFEEIILLLNIPLQSDIIYTIKSLLSKKSFYESRMEESQNELAKLESTIAQLEIDSSSNELLFEQNASSIKDGLAREEDLTQKGQLIYEKYQGSKSMIKTQHSEIKHLQEQLDTMQDEIDKLVGEADNGFKQKCTILSAQNQQVIQMLLFKFIYI